MVKGEGRSVIGKDAAEFEEGDAICIPAGEFHNVINTNDKPMKSSRSTRRRAPCESGSGIKVGGSTGPAVAHNPAAAPLARQFSQDYG